MQIIPHIGAHCSVALTSVATQSRNDMTIFRAIWWREDSPEEEKSQYQKEFLNESSQQLEQKLIEKSIAHYILSRFYHFRFCSKNIYLVWHTDRRHFQYCPDQYDHCGGEEYDNSRGEWFLQSRRC